jgi:3'(2'), 5'-bisphosphate nucleotidase
VPDLAPLLDEAIAIARDAAREILAIYQPGIVARSKADRSPVTDADERAAAVIVKALGSLTPEYPIVCEECVDAPGAAATLGRFWLVDPLDGTKEFISGNGEFTVNIALVDGGVPILGVVLAPALGRLFAGTNGSGALVEEKGERRRLGCRVPPAEGVTVVASRSHGDVDAMDAFLRGRTVARVVSAGSSLKFCMVAAGEADLYPRLGTTMEWDTAAGHAVLSAAGGRVTCVDGAALAYGKPGLVNPHFLASGS